MKSAISKERKMTKIKKKKNDLRRKSGGIGKIRMCHKGEIKSEKSSTTDCNYGAFLSVVSLLGEQRENAD